MSVRPVTVGWVGACSDTGSKVSVITLRTRIWVPLSDGMWRLVEAKIKEKLFENNVLESLWCLLAVVGATAGYIPACAGQVVFMPNGV